MGMIEPAQSFVLHMNTQASTYVPLQNTGMELWKVKYKTATAEQGLEQKVGQDAWPEPAPEKPDLRSHEECRPAGSHGSRQRFQALSTTPIGLWRPDMHLWPQDLPSFFWAVCQGKTESNSSVSQFLSYVVWSWNAISQSLAPVFQDRWTK